MTKWSQHGFNNSLKSPKISTQTSKNRHLGVVLGGVGASRGVLGRLEHLGGVLELSWGRLGGVLGHLGAVLGASWGVLGRLRGVWWRLGRVLRRLELDFHGIPSWIPFCPRFVTDLA